MDVIEKRIGERNIAIDKARIFAESLTIEASAYLVGSYSRGDFNLWSDIDVVIISNFEGNLLSRLKNMDFPPGFEIIPMTLNHGSILHDPVARNPTCLSHWQLTSDEMRILLKRNFRYMKRLSRYAEKIHDLICFQ